ncbi:MAG: nucleotidyltransferase domain-containing protein [Deinococcota bacterium]
MIAQVREQQDAISTLCKQFKVVRLELFGSAARCDDINQVNDIDVLASFAEGADLGPWLGRFSEFREALEALFAKPVDVVMDGSHLKTRFREAIQADRHVIYAY